MKKHFGKFILGCGLCAAASVFTGCETDQITRVDQQQRTLEIESQQGTLEDNTTTSFE